MIIILDTEKLNEDCGTAITIGKFDGIHLGHRSLIKECCNKEGLKSLLFTFSNSPREYLTGEKNRTILTAEERYKVAEGLGVDYFCEFPFDDRMMHIKREDFLSLLMEKFNMKHLVVGDDFTFGYKGLGNAEYLKEAADKMGFSLQVVPRIKAEDGNIISSSYVKALLEHGEVSKAALALGERFTVRGEVIHGRQLGRKIGIPTINVVPSKEKILPMNGVYVTSVTIDGTVYKAVTNVGTKPTVSDLSCVITESHLMDCNQDLYGKHAVIQFHQLVRPEMKFADVEELKEHMESDILTAVKYYENVTLI